jgi:hypothetical protein
MILRSTIEAAWGFCCIGRQHFGARARLYFALGKSTVFLSEATHPLVSPKIGTISDELDPLLPATRELTYTNSISSLIK